MFRSASTELCHSIGRGVKPGGPARHGAPYLTRDWCKTQPLKQTILEEKLCNSSYIPRHEEEDAHAACQAGAPDTLEKGIDERWKDAVTQTQIYKEVNKGKQADDSRGHSLTKQEGDTGHKTRTRV
uniref:Uncharacterized protein n=1 Tax=Denticeps clupeoides TaxID=299321 RepID=A0AAY4B1X0_9TELE